MGQELIQRMQWQTHKGQILDDDRRYIMLRTDVLMGLFRQLPASQQQAALIAFAQSVHQNGGRSAQAYFKSLDNNTGQLLDTMASFSAQLGWGVWQFSHNPGQNRLQLHVQNSPFAAGFGSSSTPVCHAITGMLNSVGQLVLGPNAHTTETCCAAQGHAQCTFTVSIASTP